MTRTVADSALMLEVMAGPHPLDYTSLEAGPAHYLLRLHEGIKGKRIAYSPDLGHARVDPEVAALVQAAAQRFTELGAHGRGSADALGRAGTRADPLLLVRAHDPPARRIWRNGKRRWTPAWSPASRRRRTYSVAEYQAMRERKMAYIAAIHRWFEDWDFLLTPAVSVAAFPAEQADAGRTGRSTTGTG